jgi:predicted ABC-type ATPase
MIIIGGANGAGKTTFVKQYLAENKHIHYLSADLIAEESVDVCINRVKERVLSGGHNVPTNDIIRRYKRSLNNFWYKYKNVVDEWMLLYNSTPGAELICNGNTNKDIKIADPNLFDIFKKVLQHEKK